MNTMNIMDIAGTGTGKEAQCNDMWLTKTLHNFLDYYCVSEVTVPYINIDIWYLKPSVSISFPYFSYFSSNTVALPQDHKWH